MGELLALELSLLRELSQQLALQSKMQGAPYSVSSGSFVTSIAAKCQHNVNLALVRKKHPSVFENLCGCRRAVLVCEFYAEEILPRTASRDERSLLAASQVQILGCAIWTEFRLSRGVQCFP